ncbi:MAG TPA: nuclear transport factor 2 family protein [Candidatus Dormibacteraeota bacterium]|nr:nuclear transport factor 2 family protein [Candidatus Dormibacteraeota bacterium]
MTPSSRPAAAGGTISDGVDRLFDAQEIREVAARAARGADQLDEAPLESSFWPDATVRCGTLPEWSREEYVRAWFTVARACAATQHHLFNDSLDVDGDVAHLETYYIAALVPSGDVDAASLIPFCGAVRSGEVAFQGGRCIDRLERRDGAWRIASRQVCGDWFATAEAGDTAPRRIGDDAAQAGTAPSQTRERLDALLARDAIRDCLNRLARGVDRLDLDVLGSVFADFEAEHDLVDTLLAQRESRPIQCHYITNLEVTLGDASARAEAYYISVRCDAPPAPRRVDMAGGRYVFDLVEQGGEWRIAGRTALRAWHAIGDGRHIDAFHTATGNKSRRGPDDASYDPVVGKGVSSTLAELLDREGVRDCLARYARGVDRLDRELIESAHVDVAPQFVEYMLGQADVRPIQNHCWANLRVELAADGLAYIEAYYIAVHGYVDGATSGFIAGTTSRQDVNLVAGRYVRWFEKVDGRWGLRNLSSATTYPPPSGGLGDWHAVLDGSGLGAYLEASGNAGRRRGSVDDPSYRRT